LAGGIGRDRDKAIDGLREERKKPDLKTKLPTQKTNFFSSNASKPIHCSTSRPRPGLTQKGSRRGGVGIRDACKLAR
jgi:hypothetical protein